MTDDPDDIPESNRASKKLRDILQRMVRVESRVTSFMRYHGFRPGVDLEAERVERVFVDENRQEVHVTSPDISLGHILDAAVESEFPELKLFVAGVYCGRITPSQPILK